MSNLVADLVNAASSGYLDKVKILLNSGVNINSTHPDTNQTALGCAIRNNQIATVQYLLERGADINRLSGFSTPLTIAKEKSLDVIITLIAKKSIQLLAKEVTEWSLLGTQKLVHIEISPVSSLKLTEIFNFSSRSIQTVRENLITGEEILFPSTSFDDLQPEALESTLNTFIGLNGVADKNFVMSGKSTLAKQKSALS